VPSEAIIMTGERSVVIVAQEKGGFDVAEVQPGAESAGYTAILAGLTEGQQVVISGQFLIDSEASLKSTVNRLSTATTEMPASATSNSAPSPESRP
jgi:Cu(I)/Ag(I) efflux system membrane fusion protein